MRRLASFALILLAGSCKGDGSDIGPEINALPENTFRVLVRDDQDRGVSSAVVTATGPFTAGGVSNRAGRVTMPILLSGALQLRVTTDVAKASDGDSLAPLTLQGVADDTRQWPFVVHLADLAPSSALTISAGIQGSPQVLDDTASSGALLTIGTGLGVDFGGASSGTIRTGSLQPHHVPGSLPDSAPGSLLTGRAVYVGPAALQITGGGADLQLPNELGLAAAAAVEVWRLDPATGVWSSVGTGTVDGGGATITASGIVTGGGHYLFATRIGSEVTLTGRVVDRDGEPLSGVLVRVAQADTRSAMDGTFVLPAIAALDGAGGARTATVEFHGGRDLFPSSRSFGQVLTAGAQDLGDQLLDSGFASAFRALIVFRGQARVLERANVSSFDGPSSAVGIFGRDGLALFEDIEQERLGFQFTVPNPGAPQNVLAAELTSPVAPGTLAADFQLFYQELEWAVAATNGTATRALDRTGGGEVGGADLFERPSGGSDQHLLTVDVDSNTIFNLDPDGEVTANVVSEVEGRKVYSAFTAREPRTGRVELPLERANRTRGNFDPYSLVRGTLPGIAGSNTVRLKADRVFNIEDWYDVVLGSVMQFSPTPLVEDPQVSGGSFSVGVPGPEGVITAVEGDTTLSSFTAQRMWFGDGLGVATGLAASLDIQDPIAYDTAFPIQGALTGLDAGIAPADLVFDHGIRLPDGRVLDVVRSVGAGNLAVSGADATVTLPALTGRLVGGQHLISLSGAATGAGGTVRQRSFAVLPDTAGVSVSLLPAPQITAPTPGASVPVGGFTAQWTVPADADYTVVKLRNETGGEVRDWTAVLPPTATTFDFRDLPAGFEDPLALGTFTLSVTCARIETGVLSLFSDVYQRVIARFQGISVAEREVNAVSSHEITVVLN